MSVPDRRTGTVRIRRDLSVRLRVVAAQRGIGIEHILSPVVEEKIADLEREARTKFRSEARPDRSTPTG
jgi:hypothetical protein